MNIFNKYLTSNKIEDYKQHDVFTYIDFVNSPIITRHNSTYPTMSIQPMSTIVELKNIVNESNIHDDILLKIMDLSSKNKNNELFEIDDLNIDVKKLLTKIQMASNNIASNGRIGPATTILMSEKTFYDFRLCDVSEPLIKRDSNNFEIKKLIGLDLVFDNKVSDIYVFRINQKEQPGIQLFYNNNSYCVKEIGSDVSNFYIKIGLSQRLKRKQKLDSL